MMTSKTNCHAAVINTRCGRLLWLVHAQNAAAQHWSRCLPKGRSLSWAHIHTKAAGPCISPQEMRLGTMNLQTGGSSQSQKKKHFFQSFVWFISEREFTVAPSVQNDQYNITLKETEVSHRRTRLFHFQLLLTFDQYCSNVFIDMIIN